MRAFVGQFDRVSLALFALGSGIGAVWLVALDLGMVLAATALVVGSIALVTRHRWIEIGLLMVGIGLVVQVGYWILGPPHEPPSLPPELGGAIPPEVFAAGMAGLLLVGGLLLPTVVGVWDLWEARRRERLEASHERRRASRLEG